MKIDKADPVETLGKLHEMNQAELLAGTIGFVWQDPPLKPVGPSKATQRVLVHDASSQQAVVGPAGVVVLHFRTQTTYSGQRLKPSPQSVFSEVARHIESAVPIPLHHRNQ